MRFINILTASAALFTTTTFAAQATINNHCSSPVFMWVDGDILGEMNTINPGDNFTSDYQTRASGGMSMKLATGTDIWSGISIAQVEYTAQPENLWYDLSLINGDPFESDFTKITPQIASESDSCTTIDCPAGFASCADAYMKSSDNYATHACPANTDLVVDLCAPHSSSKREAQAVRVHARDFSS